jgi:hypothetical protein
MSEKKYFYFFILIYLINPYSQKAQSSIHINGKVLDSLRNPLEYVSIFAIPNDKKIDISYAITNEIGFYQLKLEKNQPYKITVSHLSYLSQTFYLTLKNNITKNFVLKEDANQLSVVTLNYKIPITVKEDTITYNTGAFTNGKERKLKDILKKLPGIEVDRKGNVTSNGKKVSKLLVENKPFFTGNTKLGVNNIPADAIDKVQILDNYNEISMLKNLEDNENTVMNIKLKKNKKRFVFGDIEVGSGIKKRYLLHPKLFYYSPKTTVNFIGDLNNTGVKSFTIRDYIEFEGGMSKMISNSNINFNVYANDFLLFLNNQNIKENFNQFSAFNLRQSLNNATDISTYIISSKNKTETDNITINDYINFDNTFQENRNSNNTNDTFFTIGKITLDYDPNIETDVSFNSFVKLTNNTTNGTITTINPFLNNNITTNKDLKALTLKQNFNYNKKLSKKHTLSLDAIYNYQNNKPTKSWQTNEVLLEGLIPLENDNVFNVLQLKKTNAHLFNFIVKDYWVLSRLHHLYTSVGISSQYINFDTRDKQLLSNGDINNFNNAGFNNDFKYLFLDTYLGLEYKFKTGKVTFKPAVYIHNYKWSTEQFEQKQQNTKNLILPQLTTKIVFKGSERLNFIYKLNARFLGINNYANRFVLSNFNRVFRGNNSLKNSLYHTLTIHYYKFNLYRNYNFSFDTRFNKKIKSIKTVTELDGINQFNTPIMFNKPEHNWSSNIIFQKK